MITSTELYVMGLVGLAMIIYIIGYERGRAVEHRRWFHAYASLSPAARMVFEAALDSQP